MAPKNKFTKEEIICAALDVVRVGGIGALTAKAIADRLGVSTRPIFSYYKTMDEVKADVREAASELYEKYSEEGLRLAVPFHGFGMQYIRFAKNEPQLYRLIFLSSSVGGGAFDAMKHSCERIRPSLEEIYRITPEEADRYFRDMWLVVHSLATLIVTGDCTYSEDEIGRILTGFSVSICKAIKEIPGFMSDDFDRDRVFGEIVAE